MRLTTAAFTLCFLWVLVSCKKHDYCEKPPKHEKGCDIAQVIETSTYKDDAYSRYRFRKEYDASGNVQKVVVGLFQLSLIDSISMNVRHKNNLTYFIQDGSSADTILIATFDDNGKLQEMIQGNAANGRLPAATFTYSSGKLSKITSDFVLEPTYDAYGNVTKLEDPSHQAQSYYYTYDLSVKATKQFYSDEFFGDSYNGVYLALFMGWLPDLEPVNKRTSSQTLTGDYELYNATLTNHVYDDKGKLLSYQVGDYITFTNNWNCNTKTNTWSN